MGGHIVPKRPPTVHTLQGGSSRPLPGQRDTGYPKTFRALRLVAVPMACVRSGNRLSTASIWAARRNNARTFTPSIFFYLSPDRRIELAPGARSRSPLATCRRRLLPNSMRPSSAIRPFPTLKAGKDPGRHGQPLDPQPGLTLQRPCPHGSEDARRIADPPPGVCGSSPISKHARARLNIDVDNRDRRCPVAAQ